MTNHIHLLVEPSDDVSVLSLMMKRLAGRQAAYVNKMEKRSGALWEGRYKASPVQRDSYLLLCARYIELNPVKAMIVSQAEAYRWSSYRKRVGLEPMAWLDEDGCFSDSLDDKVRQVAYREFVNQGVSKADQVLISEALNRNQLTGGQKFIEEIHARVGRRVEYRGRGRPDTRGDRFKSVPGK